MATEPNPAKLSLGELSGRVRPCPFCGAPTRLVPSAKTATVAFVCSEGTDETCSGSGLLTVCLSEHTLAAVLQWNKRATEAGRAMLEGGE